MGLAASQSRFLAITARKASCEYKSMDYAQQKLSISRKMAKATNDYQNSLSATKLVWNASGTENAVTDLSYDVMMKPNPLNGYDPYLITNPAGQIVLSASFAKAAKEAGIPKTGGSGTLEGRNAFIDALAANGLISKSMGENVKLKEYVPDAGRGAAPLDKTTSNAMQLGSLIKLFENNQGMYGLNVAAPGLFDGTTKDPKKTVSYTTSKSKDGIRLTKNGVLQSQNFATNLNIADLLNNKIILSMETSGGTMDDETFAVKIQEVIKQIAEALGMNSTGFKGLYTDATSKLALEDAYAMMCKRYSARNTKDVSKKGNSYSIIEKNANANNLIVKDVWSKGKSTNYGVNLSNLMSTFLTYYAQALNGYDCGYTIRDEVDNSVFVTDDVSYYYVLNNDNSIGSEKDLMIVDFYNIMYNNLCSNGWTTLNGADIEDKDYLSHALKNGQLFISSLNGDGYYYQGAYTENGYVQEVTDDEAIAIAEAEYNKIKTTLTYKEERIDLQMKNLDLEISALSTEFDTVKSLISKSVEKTFSMFSS